MKLESHIEKMIRWGAIGLGAILILAIATTGAVKIQKWREPCHGRDVACIDATHIQICDGFGVKTARCASCTNDACVLPTDPMPGDACKICDEQQSSRRPSEERCTSDKRGMMFCLGCFSVWEESRKCTYDEVCTGDPSVGVNCTKR